MIKQRKMSDKHTKILLIEDNPAYACLVQKMLAVSSQVEYIVECAGRLSTGLDYLTKGEYDAVLLDLGLPDGKGLDTLDKVYARAPAVPIVVLTGIDDEVLAIQAVCQGAQDYLVKGDIESKTLQLVIRYAIERKRLEKALQESAEQFRDLFENASDLIQSVTPNGHFLYVNRAWRETLGYTQKEIHKLTLFDVIHPDSQAHCMEVFQKVISGESVNKVEAAFVAKDGKKIIVEGSANCRFVDGKPVSTRGIFRNITKRKQIEDLLGSLTLNSPVGIYIVQDGKFKFANPQFQKDTGYSENELLGMDSLKLVIPEDREMVRQNAVMMLKRERSVPYEFRVSTRGGDIKWVLEIVCSVQYRGTRATLGYLMDITERRKMQAQLLQAEKMSALGTMAAGIAHELLNPMMGMLNFSQYCLKHTSESDPRYPVLQDIERETRRCADIVRNITTFSRTGKQGEEGHQKESFARIIDRVVKLLSYRIEREHVSLTQNIAEGIPQIWMEANSMQQVLLTLISNALDALVESQKKEIHIEVRREYDFVRLIVTDNGCGIAPENLEKIYEPFFTTKPGGMGTGLGLTVSRSIINSYGGSITCESKLGVGTTFEVLLPIEKREEKNEYKHISD